MKHWLRVWVCQFVGHDWMRGKWRVEYEVDPDSARKVKSVKGLFIGRKGCRRCGYIVD